MIARLPARTARGSGERYGSLTPEPAKLKFIDRMVADSRDVALNHTAGLSLPQQVQMTLFSLFALLDEDDAYKQRCRRDRPRAPAHAGLTGSGVDLPEDPLRVGYYVDLDLEAWGAAHVGDEFVEYVDAHHDPLDIVLALARNFGTVLLNGSGFDGPPWSARVSLANLDADDYEPIGAALREIARRAVEGWRRTTAH